MPTGAGEAPLGPEGGLRVERTWDGLPISPTPPYGAAVIVWARTAAGPRFLMLHRAHLEDPAQLDWAWGPPAGARLPGEAIDTCARRELHEETGIDGEIATTAFGSADWPVYVLELDAPCRVRLSAEHDRAIWADTAQIAETVWPARVQEPVLTLARTLTAHVSDA